MAVAIDRRDEAVAAGSGAAILAAAALVAVILINAGRPDPRFDGRAAGGSSR